MDAITIWHNPRCGTSRRVLEMLRAAGHAPQVVDYQKSPPTRSELEAVLRAAGLTPAGLLRRKEPLAAELGLLAADVGEQALIAALLTHLVLIERPVVIRGDRAVLCRPAERVLDLIQATRA